MVRRSGALQQAGMKRFLLPLIALLGLALVCGLAITAIDSRMGRVYTVTMVRTELAHHPGWWVGRMVLVRGTVESCHVTPFTGSLPCQGWQPRLADAAATAAMPLPLAWGGLSPFLTFVRRVPLLGSLAPPPQVVRWDVAATYRVQLEAMPDALCGGVCYGVLLLDAAPDSP